MLVIEVTTTYFYSFRGANASTFRAQGVTPTLSAQPAVLGGAL